MRLDTLGRRKRIVVKGEFIPQPVDSPVAINDGDIALFRALYRHGPLPTHYLYQFAKGHRPYYSSHQKRLTRLANEAPQHLVPFGPAGFFATVYRETGRAREVLHDRAALEPFVPRRNDHAPHRLYDACFSASMELGAANYGLTYVSQSEVIGHRSCPEKTRQLKNPLTLPLSPNLGHQWITPDGLFAYRYPLNKSRVFARETDRGTEPLKRASRTGSASYYEKLEGYLDALENQTCLTHWGIPRFMVLTVTSSKLRMENIMDKLRDLTAHKPVLQKHFAFKVKTDFAELWQVPRDVMSDLVEDVWHTTNGTFDMTKV